MDKRFTVVAVRVEGGTTVKTYIFDWELPQTQKRIDEFRNNKKHEVLYGYQSDEIKYHWKDK